MDRNKHCRPSTFVRRLQDKLRVRRFVRELSPSIRRIWFDDRSRCCRFRRRLSPSILAMRLQCALSVCRSGLRETSSRLRSKGTRRQPGTPLRSAPRPLAPAPRRCPRPAPARPDPPQGPHLLTPLSMRLSSPGMERAPAMPRGSPLQTSLSRHPRRCAPYGSDANPSRQHKAPPPASFPPRSR